MNLRLKLPSVADAIGEDPDDPMTTQDLDAPIGSPKPNVWIPDGTNADRPEFSSGTGSDDDDQIVGGSGESDTSPQSDVRASKVHILHIAPVFWAFAVLNFSLSCPANAHCMFCSC